MLLIAPADIGKYAPSAFPLSQSYFFFVFILGQKIEANRPPRKPGWHIIAPINRTRHSALCGLQNFYAIAKSLLFKVYKKLLQAVGPKVGGVPSSHTVVWALFGFLCFLVFISLAVRFPTCNVRIAFVTVSAINILRCVDPRMEKLCRCVRR